MHWAVGSPVTRVKAGRARPPVVVLWWRVGGSLLWWVPARRHDDRGARRRCRGGDDGVVAGDVFGFGGAIEGDGLDVGCSVGKDGPVCVRECLVSFLRAEMPGLGNGWDGALQRGWDAAGGGPEV